MREFPGTTCLVSESEDDLPPSRPGRATQRPHHAHHVPCDPGPSATRAAQTTGRAATICAVCGVSTGEQFTRRAKSGKTFCQPCADQVVAAYYRRHPAARPRSGRPPGERTGIAYLQERARYAVRYHAGNGRWQIADTQTRRWTSRVGATEADAVAIAATMEAAWRTQVESEKLRGAALTGRRLAGL